MMIPGISLEVSHQNQGNKIKTSRLTAHAICLYPNTASLHPHRHENEQLLSQKHTPRGSKQATFPCFPLGKCSSLLELTLQRSKLTSITCAFSEEWGNRIRDRHEKTKHNDQTVRHLWVEREQGSGGGEKNGFLWAASGAGRLLCLASGLEMTFKRRW